MKSNFKVLSVILTLALVMSTIPLGLFNSSAYTSTDTAFDEEFNYADNSALTGWTVTANPAGSLYILNNKLHADIASGGASSNITANFNTITGTNIRLQYRFTIGSVVPDGLWGFPSGGGTNGAAISNMITSNSYTYDHGNDTDQFASVICPNHSYTVTETMNFNTKKYDLSLVDENDSANNRSLTGIDFRAHSPLPTDINKISFTFSSSKAATIDLDYVKIYNADAVATPTPTPTPTPPPTSEGFNETFNYADNSAPAGWTIDANPTGSLYILNNKLHANIASNYQQSQLTKNFDPLTGSCVRLQYRFTIGSVVPDGLWGFPNGGGTNGVPISNMIAGSSYTYDHGNDTDQWTGVIYPNHSYTVTETMNFDTKKYDLSLVDENDSANNRSLTGIDFRAHSPLPTDINKIGFTFASGTATTVDLDYVTIASRSDNAFAVSGLTYSDGTSITDGATDIPVNASLKMNFNQLMDAATLSGITISGNASMGIALDADRKSADLTFPNGLAYNKNYTITVPTTVKDYFGDTLAQPYTISFTTQDEPASMIEIGSPLFTDVDGNLISGLANGGSVKATVSVTNHSLVAAGNRTVIVLLALKDSHNKLINMSYIQLPITYGETQTMATGFELPANTSNMRCELFAWNGLPGQPYMTKKIFPTK